MAIREVLLVESAILLQLEGYTEDLCPDGQINHLVTNQPHNSYPITVLF